MAVRTSYSADNLCAKGAYVLSDAKDAKVSIFASGSEVEIAVKAADQLTKDGIAARVVSVPSFELFEKQSREYQTSVIGTAPVKIGVEAAIRQGWDRFIGSDGDFVGMNSFGASVPIKSFTLISALPPTRSWPPQRQGLTDTVSGPGGPAFPKLQIPASRPKGVQS